MTENEIDSETYENYIFDDSHATEKRFDETEEIMVREEHDLMSRIVNMILKIIPGIVFLGILIMFASKQKDKK